MGFGKDYWRVCQEEKAAEQTELSVLIILSLSLLLLWALFAPRDSGEGQSWSMDASRNVIGINTNIVQLKLRGDCTRNHFLWFKMEFRSTAQLVVAPMSFKLAILQWHISSP